MCKTVQSAVKSKKRRKMMKTLKNVAVGQTVTVKKMIKNTMQANSELEKAIRDRIETGFKNWNGGYDGWLE